jgi:hypothetical protein
VRRGEPVLGSGANPKSKLTFTNLNLSGLWPSFTCQLLAQLILVSLLDRAAPPDLTSLAPPCI